MNDMDRQIELTRLQGWIESLLETVSAATHDPAVSKEARLAFGAIVEIAIAGRTITGPKQLVVTQLLPDGAGVAEDAGTYRRGGSR